MKQILHTPEGVRDIYNEECQKKLRLQELLHDTLYRYGYRDIQTPTFEFFDVFSKEVGTVPSRELYKFFDKEGNTLVLRPDITPSVARAASKYFLEEAMPIRLCYMGNIFINNANFQGRLKETTQLGAEYMGDPTVDADGEMLALVVESLLKAGLQEFQISVGHIGYFKSLLKEAGIQEEEELALRELISNKNHFGVEELLSELEMNSSVKEALLSLPQMYGNWEILENARALAVNQEGRDAVERLEKLYQILKLYGYEKYISFDLGVVSKYKYYTGILFRAYTYGTGEPVVKGGRYDTLLEHFGKRFPSVGFAIVVDQLLTALNRQGIAIPTAIPAMLLLYREEELPGAIAYAKTLREQNSPVELLRIEEGKTLEDYRSYARRMGVGAIWYFENGGIVEELLRLHGACGQDR
ncbi:MAG: ATP phosphoribosyltransferase regulatory subunit [Lachnospiraceae bacterium]|jgi:ATP phosphoribosyltransferase regulatory subunit|nr:ATP phosphoribosyltransferase regulatory subunit [Lachnospiraceae bacterium]